MKKQPTSDGLLSACNHRAPIVFGKCSKCGKVFGKTFEPGNLTPGKHVDIMQLASQLSDGDTGEPGPRQTSPDAADARAGITKP